MESRRHAYTTTTTTTTTTCLAGGPNPGTLRMLHEYPEAPRDSALAGGRCSAMRCAPLATRHQHNAPLPAGRRPGWAGPRHALLG